MIYQLLANNISTVALVAASVLILGLGIQTYRLDVYQEELVLTQKLLQAEKESHNAEIRAMTSAISRQNSSIQKLREDYAAMSSKALRALPQLAKDYQDSLETMHKDISQGIKKLDRQECDILVEEYKKLLMEIANE